MAQAKEQKPTIKTERKVIVRSTDGDDHHEVVIDDWDGSDAAVIEKLDANSTHRQAITKALKHAERAAKDAQTEFFSTAKVIDQDGDELAVQFSDDFFGRFRPEKGPDLDTLWPRIAKALDRAGIEDAAIQRAKGYVEAYASPEKNYMIGVQCRELDGALRSQLGLEQGILVEKVFKDSSAKEADLQEHDILLKADGVALSQVSDLIDTVQAAGLEQASVKLVLLRSGKEQEISVNTQKRVLPEKNTFAAPFIQRRTHNAIDKILQSIESDDKIRKVEETVNSLKGTIKNLEEELEQALGDDNGEP